MLRINSTYGFSENVITSAIRSEVEKIEGALNIISNAIKGGGMILYMRENAVDATEQFISIYEMVMSSEVCNNDNWKRIIDICERVYKTDYKTVMEYLKEGKWYERKCFY